MVITAPSSLAVGLGELLVAGAGELVAYSLGSWVAICLYDPIVRVAGMAHVVLPAAAPGDPGPLPGKFADTAVPALLEAMRQAGAEQLRLVCKLAGGAVLAEDESTWVVYGMPRSVVEAGLADQVVPLPDMAAAIGRRLSGARPRTLGRLTHVG